MPGPILACWRGSDLRAWRHGRSDRSEPGCAGLGNADRDHRGALCDRRLRLCAAGAATDHASTGQWMVGSLQVTSNGQPVAILSGVSTCIPTGYSDDSGIRADFCDCHLTASGARAMLAGRTNR